MKISIGGVQIVDTSDGSGSTVSDLRPHITRLLQTVQPLRGAEEKFINRGNKHTPFSFHVTRPCASPAAAFYLGMALEASIPAGGALVITPSGSMATITLNGELASIAPTFIGNRLFLDITFQGGAPVVAGFVLSAETGEPLTDEAGNRLID